MEIYERKFEEKVSKITKKAFQQIHKSGNIGLVQGMVSGDISKVYDIVDKAGSDKINASKTIPVSNIDLGSQESSGTNVTVFTFDIHGNTFYGVETRYDSSKNPDVSWNTIDSYVTLYRVNK